MTTLGRNIKWICRRRGVTLKALAEKAGIERKMLYDLRNREIEPCNEDVEKIATVLGVESSFLYHEEIEPTTIGEKIQFLCEERDITPRQLSEIAGVNAHTICALINGKYGHQKNTLIKIAIGLDINIKDLYPEGQEPEYEPETTGSKIRRLCLEKGISQMEIVRRTGLEFKTVSKAVNNHNKPHALTLQKIAEVLGVNVWDLYP